VVKGRAGISKLGCLFTLLLVVAAGYFGLRAAESYFRYLKFKDAMSQEVRFRGELSDESIKERLRSVADSLGLPPEAGNVKVTRKLRVITVESAYDETIDLPGYRRDVRYAPRVSSTF
jgi:hypothetical protein